MRVPPEPEANDVDDVDKLTFIKFKNPGPDAYEFEIYKYNMYIPV